MAHKKNDPEQQRHEDNLDFLEGRMQLLDTIREMVRLECDRRELVAPPRIGHPPEEISPSDEVPPAEPPTSDDG